jgi:membrane protein DedA with SNARE-associated domain
MQRYGVFSVVIPSILPPPTPFKVFVLTAGVFRLSMGRFLSAVILGRSVRYFTWGILSVIYGELVKIFIIDHIKQVGIALLILFLLITLGIIFRHLRNRPAMLETEKHPS